jgi:hypothetical protein
VLNINFNKFLRIMKILIAAAVDLDSLSRLQRQIVLCPSRREMLKRVFLILDRDTCAFVREVVDRNTEVS